MNEPNTSPEQNNPAEPPQATPAAAQSNAATANPTRRTSLVQIILVVMLVLFLLQWFATHRQIDGLSKRLTEMESNNKVSLELAKQEQETVRELSTKVGMVEAKLAETQNQRTALEELYQNVSATREEMLLADVEQLLMIAGQQLETSGNVKAALLAMQQADEQLRRMNRPSLANLRKAVARDLENLRGASVVDAVAINAQLDKLHAAVDSWPLLQDAHVTQQALSAGPAEAQGFWQKLWNEVWGELRQLVHVENMQRDAPPLLSPTQSFFLRENLKLRLLSARLAVLAHDDVSFKRELQTAQEWLQRYFDAKSAGVAEAAAALRKLNETRVRIDLANISNGLQAVRNYRASLAQEEK